MALSFRHRKFGKYTALIVTLLFLNVLLYLTVDISTTLSATFSISNKGDSRSYDLSSSHNLVPYYQKCRYNPEYISPGMEQYGAMYHGILTKQLIYKHVFKAGGTTIQKGIRTLIHDKKLINLTFLKKKKKFKRLIDSVLVSTDFVRAKDGLFLKDINKYIDKDALIFTFIRDPISKALSAFFEINFRAYFSQSRTIYRRRIINNLNFKNWKQYKDLDGMTAFQHFIDIIYKRTKQNVPSKAIYPRNYFIDPHFAPNLFFLMHNGQQNKSLSYYFIGDLKNLGNDLPKLLNGYLSDEQLKNNGDLLMEKYFPSQRNRNNATTDPILARQSHNRLRHDAKYNLKSSQLGDDYIKKLCEIYFMDYLCFPSFRLPSQCDLDSLMEHIGVELQIIP